MELLKQILIPLVIVLRLTLVLKKVLECFFSRSVFSVQTFCMCVYVNFSLSSLYKFTMIFLNRCIINSPLNKSPTVEMNTMMIFQRNFRRVLSK